MFLFLEFPAPRFQFPRECILFILCKVGTVTCVEAVGYKRPAREGHIQGGLETIGSPACPFPLAISGLRQAPGREKGEKAGPACAAPEGSGGVKGGVPRAWARALNLSALVGLFGRCIMQAHFGPVLEVLGGPWDGYGQGSSTGGGKGCSVIGVISCAD